MGESCCNSKDNEYGSAQHKTENTKSCCSADELSSQQDLKTNSCCTSEAVGMGKGACCSGDDLASEQARYRIYGMDCPSCALSIEKSLVKLEGIGEAKVNYNTAKLHVTGNSLDRVETEVQKLGFKIEPINERKDIRTYVVEGMDCSSCAKSIENHLNTVPGVRQVNVHFSTGKMKVDHENSVEEIIAEVSKIGFRASLPAKGEQDVSSIKEGYGSIITSGVLIALGFSGSFMGISPLVVTLLYAAAMIISGYKPVKSAFYSVKSRSLDMNVLMSAAAIGAALIGEWLEGATVVWLFALGTTLQTMSRKRGAPSGT
jgi:Zn2+/Cd2+-exporting ATPase